MEVSVHIRLATFPNLAMAIIAFSSLLATQAQAADNLQLRWNDLSPLVTGNQVRLPLKDGVRIVGTAREVSASAIQLEVTGTSDRNAYPKGLVAVPRQKIDHIEVLRPRRHKGTVIGGIVGAVIAAGTSAGFMQANSSEGEMAVAVVAPLVVCTGVGWLIDHRAPRVAKQITIVPD